MKLSKYNIEKNEKDGLLIYNSVTSAILELEEEYEKSYNEIKVNGTCNRDDLMEALVEGGMLVEEDKDEFAELMVRNQMERFSDSSLTLTIAPTLACNFCCPYCYEQGREYITMNEEIQQALIQQIQEKYQHIHEMAVSWYGGEPLLALDLIEKLTKEIKNVLPENCVYHADMVSNGYNLTREVAERLLKMDIQFVQVTLDGSKKAHDSRRILHNHKPTFERILKNIRECAELINISVRINVDKSNIEDATEIFEWLEKYELKNKVGYYLAPVDDINGVCNSTVCIERSQYAAEEIAFYREGIRKGFLYHGVKPTNYGICGAVSLNSFVIGPDGDIYKCWNDIGYKDRSIGNLKSGIRLTGKFVKWLAKDILKDTECKSCNLFPVCFGGCAAYKEKVCTSMKWNMNEVLELMRNTAQ